MRSNQLNCDAELLSQFLNDELSEDQRQAVERHLDDCGSCQAALDGLAAEPSWWQEARHYLDADPQTDASTVDEAHVNADLDTISLNCLHFLGPTDDPRMIGRLGSYEIAGVIGSGGMGIVLKGFDPALNRFVAIKVLAPHLATSGAARRRFAREARAAAAVVHENIIAIHNVAEGGGLPYLVMPYERGASLQKRLSDNGPLELSEILRVGMQTAQGLAAAHAQGLVHRDIKPANILLDDGTERVKITDFGLARATDDASLTHTGVIAGTPQFMSPEQATGDSIDVRSDLFSLGSVLYAMCTGRPPFRAETPYGVLSRIRETEPRPIQEINEAIPDWLCRLVAQLHAKQPDDRISSASEVAQLLADCLAHVQQPATVSLPLQLQQAFKPRRQPSRKVAAVAIGLVGCLLLPAAAWLLIFHRSSSTTAPKANASAADQEQAVEDVELDWGDEMAGELLEIEYEVNQLDHQTRRTLVGQNANAQADDPGKDNPQNNDVE